MIKQQVRNALATIINHENIVLLAPKNEDHGDYAIHSKSLGQDITPEAFTHELFGRIEKTGEFINFSVSQSVLWKEIETILENKELYGQNDNLKGKKIIVEFAHPNTHKLFHIGHLRNISLGESLSRLLSASGAKIIRANYQGDVGLHIAKCLYGILKREDEMKTLKTLDEKIAFLGSTYTQGNVAYEENTQAKDEINIINRQIFDKDPKIKALWQETRSWSLEYYDKMYKRLGTKFDRLFFESEVTDTGLAITKKAVEQELLEKSDRAVIFNGGKYGVDTRVFINSLGLPTYEAKELGLGELEFSEFGEIDKCIHIVTHEQSSFFKVVFKVQELLNEKKYKGKQLHFSYEFVDLKGEKMSSRTGNIVTGEWLLDEIKTRVKKIFATEETGAEVVAVSAAKYAFLKVDAKRKIVFDINESISIHGNSGPYLLYTFARIQSILKKNSSSVMPNSFRHLEIPALSAGRLKQVQDDNKEELSLLRTLFKFPEVVESAAEKMAPHLIATYLFDLAQKFNKLYESTPILKAKDEERARLLSLIAATAQVIKNGLYLLGIETLDSI
ncbi:arginine--tRNA ligase [Candidatus Roizmanbacteria bacterium RIFCSPHIGHO2_02_FULL_40_13b]|uniref:Arginine--tRNA ligase n=1 Tax=Candidatus Roizmanbacteria bacterium RIFCSPHIGHO2_01_FULL_39_24 TaxID=1802032 RepID=A0A1F7GID5_9BACT|nr:MAG: arginine--tRNA ligase [Candidatus Roizmanbacteria bacterium RIFCSPHIGHO2_01_FULL_39_24]OGK26339.1 MAG: arginine--tRNA ligase [Candidatus Roizmanbacteria bacterium RIFCSPHIGHO2_02_FULL_40_13b]OGK50152.1 MAG: arginine--tRNA ligase [Candidatus Roizmanbacteria bacterium RIFCSPLOWO2_01_FULL_40_32]OGK56819.1 MAG: arginine--tRNA ligase [Candidatus Roizmanbacteria bacterium RIFCSPLOWO2_02_FULL_39_8]